VRSDRTPAANEPRAESFEIEIPDGTVRVEGWIRDRRYALDDLRLTMPAGRILRVAVSRRTGGSFVDWEDDEHDCCGGHFATCVPVVLGFAFDTIWPDWAERFIDELCDKLAIPDCD
jgi:hypothetical protein